MKVEERDQEIILNHYRSKITADCVSRTKRGSPRHRNCGDEVRLRVHLVGDTVSDVSYEGVGCSISQASTSVMTDLVIGHDVAYGMSLYEEFLTMMQGKGQIEPNEERLEDGIAFAGVAKFPARVKCALIGWSALRDAIIQAQSASS